VRNDAPASPKAMNLGLLLARAPLGVWLVLAGFAKFSADGGVQRFVKQFAGVVPGWVPESAGRYYLTGVPYAEIVIGAALVLGVAGRLGGMLASLLIGSLMLLTITGIRAANLPFNPNVALLGVALLVCLAGPGAFSMDRFMWGDAGGQQASPSGPRGAAAAGHRSRR
jgi:uncharacterized membrane protein YphA (DoxX/SURF4 family)